MNPSPDTIEQVIERNTVPAFISDDQDATINVGDLRILLEALSRNREPTEAMIESECDEWWYQRTETARKALVKSPDLLRRLAFKAGRARTKGDNPPLVVRPPYNGPPCPTCGVAHPFDNVFCSDVFHRADEQWRPNDR